MLPVYGKNLLAVLPSTSARVNLRWLVPQNFVSLSQPQSMMQQLSFRQYLSACSDLQVTHPLTVTTATSAKTVLPSVKAPMHDVPQMFSARTSFSSDQQLSASSFSFSRQVQVHPCNRREPPACKVSPQDDPLTVTTVTMTTPAMTVSPSVKASSMSRDVLCSYFF